METKYKIHAFYIVSILVLAIIALVTIEWSAVPRLVDYITFALTVTSLVLALLAIAYSMYSNTSFSQNVATLDGASRLLSGTAERVSEASDELTRKVETLPSMIERVGERVDETQTLIKGLSTEAGSRPVGSVSDEGTKTEPLSSFLEAASSNGLQTLYACHVAYQRKVAFDLKELCEKLEYGTYSYSWGFLVACTSAGVLGANISHGIWNIVEFNPLVEGVAEELDRRIEGTEPEELQAALRKNKETIEEYIEG